jgi:FlaA1/EpsC-like NDP-sugar epimerase
VGLNASGKPRFNLCDPFERSTDCPVMSSNLFMEMKERVRNAKLGKAVLDVAPEDLLGREQGHLDQEIVDGHIRGRVILVTGAAGSIGSELCRQIAAFGPLAMVAFDQAETALLQLESELAYKYPDLDFHSEIGNITDFHEVTRTFERHRPSIVFHAAAYKHVPMLETHVFAAVENNIFGTWHVAQAAASCGVEFFVLISTDKAVCPASVMGATKHVAEQAMRALNKDSHTKFVAVRLGNVLGSSGSVVPIFRRQIAMGGPVTVTHPDMKRYFMAVSEAGQLVLHALVLGEGGEILVPDMGEPVSILALARNFILLSGLDPDRDIKIEFTGARPGEKLVEQLHKQNEQLIPTPHSKIYTLLHSGDVDAPQLTVFLEELKEAVGERDALSVILLLKKMVPDYLPSSQLLQDAMRLHKNCGIADDAQDLRSQSIAAPLFASK